MSDASPLAGQRPVWLDNKTKSIMDRTIAREQIERIAGLEILGLYNNDLRDLSTNLDSLKCLKKVYVRDSGIPALALERLRKGFPRLEFTEELPKELYFQLH